MLERERDFWRRASDPEVYPRDKTAYYPGHAEAHGHHLLAGKRVLEYGCGGGSDVLSMLRAGASVDFADIVRENVEATRARISAEFPAYDTPTVGVVLESSRLDHFADESFDAITAHGVLHHILDPAPVLHDMHRVLRPGGELYAMLYTERYWSAVKTEIDQLVVQHNLSPMQAFARITDGEGCPYATTYTYERGEELLRTAGLELIGATDYNHGYFRVFRAKRNALSSQRSMTSVRAFYFEGWSADEAYHAAEPAATQAQILADRLRLSGWEDVPLRECVIEAPFGRFALDTNGRVLALARSRQSDPSQYGILELQRELVQARCVGRTHVRRKHDPRIIWIASGVTEAEYDLHLDGIDVYCHEDPIAQRNGPCELSHELPEELIYKDFPRSNELSDRIAFLRRLAAVDADLLVFRYPYWLAENAPLLEEFYTLFRDRPAVGWTSEQGPMRQGTAHTLLPFHHVAANNWIDVEFYRRTFPEKVVHYLPFGCRRNVPASSGNPPREVIADGTPHYACGRECARVAGQPHGKGSKEQSVEIMVEALLTENIGVEVWGNPTSFHGWRGVPAVVKHGAYRGSYSPDACWKVYAAYKIYSGITWNWSMGGYGTKLARALSTGIAVMWHKTVGMELDGLLHGAQLLAPATGAEAVELARSLLDDVPLRTKIGKAGREFALEQWTWTTNLRRLAAEL